MSDQKIRRRFLAGSQDEVCTWIQDTFGIDPYAVTSLTIKVEAGRAVTVTAEMFADDRLTRLAFPTITPEDGKP